MKSSTEELLSMHFRLESERHEGDQATDEPWTDQQVREYVKRVLRDVGKDRMIESNPAVSGDHSVLPALSIASQLMLRRFHAEWDKLATEAYDHAMLRLRILVADLTERYKATSGSLFFLDGDTLTAKVTHHSCQYGLQLNIDDQGIVAHVARRKAPYLCKDVAKDSVYLDLDAETRSELAVPIFDTYGALVGVLNLESKLLGQFSDEQVGELSLAVSRLLLHMLVIRHLPSCPYHPGLHGWSLSLVLDRLCRSVAGALDEAAGNAQADTTTCTVWHCDHAKRELFVSATSGFDIEYIADQTLPMDSFTGRVTALPRGEVWDTPADQATGFVRMDKVKTSGMTRIQATPVYVDRFDTEGLPSSTLNIYFLTERSEQSVPSRQSVAMIADEMGCLLAAYRQQRPKLGRAFLRHELHELPQPAETGCEVVKNVLHKVLEAQGCSLFTLGVGEEEERRLYCATTTGIEIDQQSRGLREFEIFYHLDHDRGYTTSVALNPGIAVRKNDVINEDEQGVPETFPRRPLDKFREKFALSELDRRRWLGIGVAYDGERLGVLRLNRASASKPFTCCDAELLEGLADLDECKRALIDRQKQLMRLKEEFYSQRFERPELSIRSEDDSDASFDALAYMLRPVPTVGAIRPLVDELLQTLLVIFRQYGVEQAGVLYQSGKDSDVSWYAQHFRSYKSLPIQPWVLEWNQQAMDHRDHILTFERSANHTDDNGCVAGARVPVIAWTGQRQLNWTLALDFQQPVKWGPNQLQVLFHVTRRLAAILGRSEYVIRPGGLDEKPEMAMARLVALTREHEGIRADGAALRFRYGASMQTVYQVGQPFDETADRDWEEMPAESGGEEAALFGVKKWRDGSAWSLPLRLGPFPIGEMRCSLSGSDLQERRDELLRTIPVLWPRLTSELWSPFGERPIEFTPTRYGGGIAWKEKLTLPRGMKTKFDKIKDQPRSTDLLARL